MSSESPVAPKANGSNVVLIIGDDDYLVAEAAKKVVGDGVGLELFDSNTSTNAELQLRDLRAVEESFMTPPFFDPKKVTWWKNVHFLPHQGKGAPSEDVKIALEKFANLIAATVLPENQKLLITGSKLKMDSIFAKTVKGVAEVIEFAVGKPWERAKKAAQRATEFANELGIAFMPGAVEKFIAIVGCDSRSILSELGKMRDYLGPDCHVIDAEAVETITSPGIVEEPEIWSVTDALGARDLEATMKAIKRFEQESGFAVFVSGAIEKLFRQLAELKDAQERGRFNEATEGMAPFVVRKMTGFLPKWRLVELRRARARFMNLREKAVSSGESVGTLIITEIVRTCGVRRRSA